MQSVNDDWDADDLPELEQPTSERHDREAQRYFYGGAVGFLLCIALISPEARWMAAVGILGAVVYWPTFERSLL